MASLLSDGSPRLTRPNTPLDRAAALILIFALAPVMVLAACAVLLSGPGEIFVRVPVVGPHGAFAYRWAFRISPRFEPVRYDEAARRSKSWLTPVGAALRLSGIARLPVLFDVCAGRVSVTEGLTS